MTVYLDQNVFSLLRPDQKHRAGVLRLLRSPTDPGAIFCFSDITVREMRLSGDAEGFVAAIEAIDAWHMGPGPGGGRSATLTFGNARSLLLSPPSGEDAATASLERALMLLQYSFGWLGATSADELKGELAAELRQTIEGLAEDMPEAMRQDLLRKVAVVMPELMSLPLDALRQEDATSAAELAAALPANLAQLDEVPDEDAAEFLLDRLPGGQGAAMRALYPKGFWAAADARQEGQLAGFAFLLYRMGLVRNRKDKASTPESRDRAVKRVAAQFRDCQHIEKAADCAGFVTRDKGAVRLARACYAYAGVGTAAALLEIPDQG